MTLSAKRILLVIGGGIAAYKALDLIRRLRERGAVVTPVMTRRRRLRDAARRRGARRVPRAWRYLRSGLRGGVGHIRLARNADVVVVAPATADRMARTAAGLADDLAGAILLATRAPVLFAPAMNPAMWDHPATRRSLAI